MVGQLSPVAFYNEMSVSVGMAGAVRVLQLKYRNIFDTNRSLLSRKQ